MKKQRKQSVTPVPAATPGTTPLPRHSPWRDSLMLLAGGWGALLICALLWHFWTGRALIVYFSAGVVGLAYTFAILFDHFRK